MLSIIRKSKNYLPPRMLLINVARRAMMPASGRGGNVNCDDWAVSTMIGGGGSIGQVQGKNIAAIDGKVLLHIADKPYPMRTYMQIRPRKLLHSNTGLWKFERIVAIAMIVILPIAFIAPSKGLDLIMAIAIVVHTHFGMDGIVGDYIRPNNVGLIAAKLAKCVVFICSLMALEGFLWLIFKGIGLATTIKKLWALGKPAPEKSCNTCSCD